MARFANLVLASITLTRCSLALDLPSASTPSDQQGGHREIFYVGDGNNAVRRYDARTGEYLDSSRSPVVANGVFVFIDPNDGTGAGGLAGPRGIVLDDERLLVSNQNVGLPLTSALLEFRRATGSFKDALLPALSVSTTQRHLPHGAPWCCGETGSCSFPTSSTATWIATRTRSPWDGSSSIRSRASSSPN